MSIKAFISFLGVQSPAYTTYLKIFGGSKFVGEDQLGNKYYRAKPRKGYKKERRWIIYKDGAEASMIPAEWHGWLHHQSDDNPSETGESYRRSWQKPHKPNMTGTSKAYKPSGHVLSNNKRDAVTGDYEAWTPNK